MAPPSNQTTLSADSLSASGRSSEKQSLQSLQSKMKCDPESYEAELIIIYNQFQSSLELFRQQANLSFNSLSGIAADTTVAKDLGERSLFLAHMTRFYAKQLFQFPSQLADLLNETKKSLPSHLRCQISQALILLINRKIMPMDETLALFMELQTLGDRTLKKLAYSHVVRFIQRMNKKHKDEAKNKPLQKILFDMLNREEESIAKRSLVTLCDLHRRNVWSDERTVNAICMACFHPSSRIMVAALSFLLDFEKIQDDDDSDASSSDDEATTPQPHVTLSREDVYKAHHKGTSASKKKKKAKLQRVMRSLKKQQRLSSEKSGPNYYSPLSKLKDPQGFAEKLFSRLQSCNERFEVKMMMLKVIARTIGLHQLLLLNFYPFLQKYAQPHQRDVTNLLAAAVQACHDMVPPDAVEPLFKQIVNQFVHDRSRTEAIAVGLNVVREICLRMPLLMTEDLLQDLVLYKKSNEKAVSSAARSLISLFREICPSLLVKKDRGRPTDPTARPKAYGEVNVATDVPGADMLRLKNDDDDVEAEDADDADDNDDDDTDDDNDDGDGNAENNDADVEGDIKSDTATMGNSVSDDDLVDEDSCEDAENEGGSVMSEEDSEEVSDADDSEDDELCSGSGTDDCDEDNDEKDGGKKRKFADFDKQLDAASTSLRALKKLAAAKFEPPSEEDGHIYSNEDFQRIKELQAKEKARAAMTQHGLLKGSNSKSASITIPSSDKLSLKPVDPAKLEANIRRKMTKEQRIDIMKAGREERGEYKARTAVKQNKKGGSSNRQKDHKKFMPIAAKRSKVARSRQDKKRKQMRSGKQFRGKKAWK